MVKFKKTPFLAAVFACLLGISCDTPTSGGGSENRTSPDTILDTANFYAIDYSSNSYYKITADKKAEGQKCEIWVEKDGDVTSSDARAIAAEFDKNIYPIIKNTFGIVSINGTQMDALEIGDVNKDGRVLLLLMDIKEGVSTDGSYVAGLFDPYDLLNYPYSNKVDMLYIDINPGKTKSSQFYAVIAHELQHLIHFALDKELRVEGLQIYQQDHWLDEGLSTAAEYLYFKNRGSDYTDRVEQFNADSNVARGNTFFVWEGLLADYATVYLFFQWLRIQSGDVQIYRDILTSTKRDYTAVMDAAATAKITAAGTWETLLGAWFRANYNPKTGYNEEINPVVQYASGGSIGLKPGEGIYSGVPASPPSKTNISYEELPGPKALTFNSNPNNKGGSVEVTVPASQLPASTASRAAAPLKPYPIDVADLFGGRRPPLPAGTQEETGGYKLNPDGQ
ncbi:MAG: hypothetical protein LBD47_08725 [Treponema sp.]|nr:hypothetical protein [Treponema sp.]